jgi:hypothetical protein
MGALAGLQGNDLWKATRNGAITGGLTGLVGGFLIGGIQAKLDGRDFLLGTKFTKETISSDIPVVGQKGSTNCGPASVEAVDKKLGGNLSQEQVRGWYRNNSGRATPPMLDADKLWTDYVTKMGHELEICEPPFNDEFLNVYSRMKSGDIVVLNYQQHTYIMNEAVHETFMKVNGNIIYDTFIFNAMNPADGGGIKPFNFLDIDKASSIYYIRP